MSTVLVKEVENKVFEEMSHLKKKIKYWKFY